MTDVPTTPNEGDRTTEQDNEEFEALRRTDSNDLTDTDAGPADLGQHYADVQSEPLNLTPEDQERIAQSIEEGEREIAEGDPTGLEAALKEMPTADDLKARPPFILSEVDGLVIGWDTCGECHHHIRVCLCPSGPKQPRYVTKFREQQEERDARLAQLKAERETREVRAPRVEADPAEVELRVREVTEVTPSGRKKRSDAGKPRGPRKKADATPESVLEAAGDLSQAMKDS